MRLYLVCITDLSTLPESANHRNWFPIPRAKQFQNRNRKVIGSKSPAIFLPTEQPGRLERPRVIPVVINFTGLVGWKFPLNREERWGDAFQSRNMCAPQIKSSKYLHECGQNVDDVGKDLFFKWDTHTHREIPAQAHLNSLCMRLKR